jgi:hypothetical protein
MLEIEVSGSELNGYNIFEDSSFHRFIPEGYMIKQINFYQEEEFNNPYFWGEARFLIIANKIGG